MTPIATALSSEKNLWIFLVAPISSHLDISSNCLQELSVPPCPIASLSVGTFFLFFFFPCLPSHLFIYLFGFFVHLFLFGSFLHPAPSPTLPPLPSSVSGRSRSALVTDFGEEKT
jgi:hypothetical protein